MWWILEGVSGAPVNHNNCPRIAVPLVSVMWYPMCVGKKPERKKGGFESISRQHDLLRFQDVRLFKGE